MVTSEQGEGEVWSGEGAEMMCGEAMLEKGADQWVARPRGHSGRGRSGTGTQSPGESYFYYKRMGEEGEGQW